MPNSCHYACGGFDTVCAHCAECGYPLPSTPFLWVQRKRDSFLRTLNEPVP